MGEFDRPPGKSASQAQGRGLGMGLHVAYRIVVNRHGGTIEAGSRPAETVFRVRLPLRNKGTDSV